MLVYFFRSSSNEVFGEDCRKIYYVCQDNVTERLRIRMLMCKPNEVIRAVFVENKAGIIEPFRSNPMLFDQLCVRFLYLLFSFKVIRIFLRIMTV